MVTNQIIHNFLQCKYKAYIKHQGRKGIVSDYESLFQGFAERYCEQYFQKLEKSKFPVYDGSRFVHDQIFEESSFIKNIYIETKEYKIYFHAIQVIKQKANTPNFDYIPIIIIPEEKVNKENKLVLAILCELLEKATGIKLTYARIIFGADLKSTKLNLLKYRDEAKKTYLQLLSLLNEEKAPSFFQTKECTVCEFRSFCKKKLVERDDLSLLSHIKTAKQIKRYERKGIFTVNQVSYLYRPRKQRKRSRKPPALRHSIELQALVLRTKKIYLHVPPLIHRSETEIFLDIEGIPDKRNYYLIGVLLTTGNDSKYYAYWADSDSEEEQIWLQLLRLLNDFPDSPVYHYGNYELKAIKILGDRYQTKIDNIVKRLVNVNTFIYSRVYFPVYSNSLKEIGRFIGASWESVDATGIESLVWRYNWLSSLKIKYKNKLLIYNQDDCQALKLLVDFLSVIKEKDDSILDVDFFVHSKKSRNSKVKNPLHEQLEKILTFAHTDYNKSKISFTENIERKDSIVKKIRRTKPLKKNRRVTKIIQVENPSKCKRCGSTDLGISKRKTERITVDLVFSKNGVRKSVVKRWAHDYFCRNCRRYNIAPKLEIKGSPRVYGYGFKVWIVYQRIVLRQSYRNIVLTIKDIFNEDLVGTQSVADYLKEVAYNYSYTEEKITQKLLNSPFLHADETLVNIGHVNQYIWVFTDGKNVLYKYTETREASFVQQFLENFEGVLISDFYSGYDALECKHQRCLVHIIRDINNDLWSNPFDIEFEKFVVSVKELFTPIMAAIQKYGLKKRNLNKFKKNVDKFYDKVIENKFYKSDLCTKYQERFKNYRGKLFTFLEIDGIPWHNNPAENALRAVTLQFDVSHVLHASVINEYLTLLGIKQTCKYQNKSFLRFLLSNEQDVDSFKVIKLRKQR